MHSILPNPNVTKPLRILSHLLQIDKQCRQHSLNSMPKKLVLYWENRCKFIDFILFSNQLGESLDLRMVLHYEANGPENHKTRNSGLSCATYEQSGS